MNYHCNTCLLAIKNLSITNLVKETTLYFLDEINTITYTIFFTNLMFICKSDGRKYFNYYVNYLSLLLMIKIIYI